jgi:Tfp pilus assembly protein PilV
MIIGGHHYSKGARGAPPRGAALLEVVLALALFFGMAVVLLSGLTACVHSTQQIRLSAQASDLAVSILSEVQMGYLPTADAGPTAFGDPLGDWTWEVAVAQSATATAALVQTSSSTAAPDMSCVEVIVRNTPSGYSQRLYEVVPTPTDTTGSTATSTATTTGG